MATTNATRTALVAGTLVTPLPLLNGFGGDRRAHAAAWLGHPRLGKGLDK
jgi:hypothetical protein